jgi:hypothetical protein
MSESHFGLASNLLGPGAQTLFGIGSVVEANKPGGTALNVHFFWPRLNASAIGKVLASFSAGEQRSRDTEATMGELNCSSVNALSKMEESFCTSVALPHRLRARIGCQELLRRDS